MAPTEYFRALRRSWVALLLLTVLGAVAALGYALSTPDQYRASASVFVSANDTGTSEALLAGNRFSQDAVQSFVELATLPAVLDPVITRLGLDTSAPALAKRLAVSAPLDTTIIEIDATDTDATRAARIARAAADSLITQSGRLAPTYKGDVSLSMRVVAAPSVPTEPIGLPWWLAVLIGAIGGLALGVVVALARQVFDTRVVHEDDLVQQTGVPLLGTVRRSAGGPLAVRDRPGSEVTEDHRRLMTNVEFAGLEDRITIVAITSPRAGEGKTTVALNLALAAAERGSRVLLVDADLRRPATAAYAGVDASVGLVEVLRGGAALGDAVRTIPGTRAELLPAGSLPPNPGQLVGSAAMAGLLTSLRQQYDLVLLDAPPLLPVADALTLSTLADGVVVVAAWGETRLPDLDRSLDSLDQIDTTVLGLAVTRVPVGRADAYGEQDAAQLTSSGR